MKYVYREMNDRIIILGWTNPLTIKRYSLAHRLLFMFICAFPPYGEERDFRPNEFPTRIFGQFHNHIVEDMLGLVIVVLVKCFDPSCHKRRAVQSLEGANRSDLVLPPQSEVTVKYVLKTNALLIKHWKVLKKHSRFPWRPTCSKITQSVHYSEAELC